MYDPKAFFEILKNNHGYKLKGVGNPEYHPRGDFGCDPDGTSYWSAKTYIDKMLKTYERMFDGPPSKRYSCPIEKMIIQNLMILHYCQKKISRFISL